MYGLSMRNAILVAAILAASVGGMAVSAARSNGDGKEFTACMRSHRLPGFPEVTFSTDGLVNFDINGEHVDVLSSKYGAAVRACEFLLPHGFRLPGRPAAPAAPSLPS